MRMMTIQIMSQYLLDDDEESEDEEESESEESDDFPNKET